MTPAKRPSTRARQTRIQSLDDLQPDPLNANRGTDRGREALRRSLHTYGTGRSIVIDRRGRILGGHKTVEQAKHLGLPITVVPTSGQELVVVQRVDLDARTDPRAQELALADNRVAELDLDWDPAVLRQLEQAGVALEAFWTPEEFARLLAPEGPEAQPDENTVLAPPTTTTIRRGDVFQLGRHRLACGDATSATDVARLLAGATPCLMVTDPPYGVNYQPAFRHKAYPRQRTAVGRVTNDTQADWAAAYALFPGDIAYVWHAALFADVVMAGLRQAEFEVRSEIVWAKPDVRAGPRRVPLATRTGVVRRAAGARRPVVRRPGAEHRVGGAQSERHWRLADRGQHAHRPCDAETRAGVRDPDPQSHHGAGRRL